MSKDNAAGVVGASLPTSGDILVELENKLDQELFRLWTHAVTGGYANPDHPYVQKWIKQSAQAIQSLLVQARIDELEHLTSTSLGVKRHIVKEQWNATQLSERLQQLIQDRIKELKGGE